MSVLDRAAQIKMRYTRGTTWLQFLLNFGIITANMWIFQDLLPKVIPMSLWYLVALVVYCLICYAIGHIDEKYGIWNLENQYGVVVSPPTRVTLEMLGKILKRQEDLQAAIDLLKAE